MGSVTSGLVDKLMGILWKDSAFFFLFCSRNSKNNWWYIYQAEIKLIPHNWFKLIESCSSLMRQFRNRQIYQNRKVVSLPFLLTDPGSFCLVSYHTSFIYILQMKFGSKHCSTFIFMPWDKERRKEDAREAKTCKLYAVDKQMCVLLEFDEKEEIITKKVGILDIGRELRISAT